MKKTSEYILLLMLLMISYGCGEKINHAPVLTGFSVETTSQTKDIYTKQKLKISIGIYDADGDVFNNNISSVRGKIERIAGEYFYTAPDTEGSDTINIQIIDEHGKETVVGKVIFVKENRAPELKEILINGKIQSVAAYERDSLIDFEMVDYEGDFVFVNSIKALNGGVITKINSSYYYRPLSKKYVETFEVDATDQYGYKTTEQFALNIEENTAPEIKDMLLNGTTQSALIGGIQVTIDFEISDYEGDDFYIYSLKALKGGIIVNVNSQYCYIPENIDYIDTIAIEVKDKYGYKSVKEFSVNITENMGPEIKSMSVNGTTQSSVIAGKQVLINFDLLDKEGESTSINYVKALSGGQVTSVENQYYYTPKNEVYTETIEIEAQDEVGNKTTKKFTVSVIEGIKAEVSLMIYLAGDDNILDGGRFTDADLNEIRSAAGVEQGKVNVIIYADYMYKNPGIFIKNGNTIEKIETLTEWNTGDKRKLTSMINYTHENYPAKKYIISLWGHGSGWVDDGTPGKNQYSLSRAIAIDSSDGDSLDMWEVEGGIKESTLGKVDIVYTDACLMGMLEVAYQLQTVADVLAFSPELTPGNGGEYKGIIEYLATTENEDAATIARNMQICNYESYKPLGSQALTGNEIMNVVFSVFDMRVAKANNMFTKFNSAAQKIYSEIDILKNHTFISSNILSYDNDSRSRAFTNYVDLGVLLGEIKKSGVTSETKADIDLFLTAMNEARNYLSYQNGYLSNVNINYNYIVGSNTMWETSGIAIFFPFEETYPSKVVDSYTVATSFGAESIWTQIVGNYYKK